MPSLSVRLAVPVGHPFHEPVPALVDRQHARLVLKGVELDLAAGDRERFVVGRGHPVPGGLISTFSCDIAY